jgi:pilus assembly protein FimV
LASVAYRGGWWPARRRRKTGVELKTAYEQRLDPPAKVGGASGGSVNTGDSSFLTDFSQAGLGTIDTHDVDPIAEAEVYMAYGRDAQAEEILKEAIGKNPDRNEIRVKLLEIYAARRNAAAFGTAASFMPRQTQPAGTRPAKWAASTRPTPCGSVESGASPAATVAATTAVAGAVTFADEPIVPRSLAELRDPGDRQPRLRGPRSSPAAVRR